MAPQSKKPVQHAKKTKNKAKADGEDAQVAVKSGKAAKGGRTEKSTNYDVADHKKLLELIIEDPPQGQNGWVRIAQAFKEWAAAEGRQKRGEGSLKDKYYRVCIFMLCAMWLLTLSPSF